MFYQSPEISFRLFLGERQLFSWQSIVQGLVCSTNVVPWSSGAICIEEDVYRLNIAMRLFFFM